MEIVVRKIFKPNQQKKTFDKLGLYGKGFIGLKLRDKVPSKS